MQYAGKLILFILFPFAGNLTCKVIFCLFFRIGYIRSNAAILKAALTGRLIIGNITGLFNNRACCQTFCQLNITGKIPLAGNITSSLKSTPLLSVSMVILLLAAALVTVKLPPYTSPGSLLLCL